MVALNLAYIKTDLSYNVIDYNDNLKQLFNLSVQENSSNLSTMITDLPSNLLSTLDNIIINETKTIMIIKDNPNYKNGAVLFLYAIIQKTANNYIIRIINWLSWIHGLHNSISNGYNLISNLDTYVKQNQFRQISKAACFKVFYPLITHVPHKFIHGISQGALFGIMRLFTKQRNEDSYSKDYARNLYLSLKSSLRRDCALDHTDIFDVLFDEEKLPINYQDNIQIPNTLINENVTFLASTDKFLNSIIDVLHPINKYI